LQTFEPLVLETLHEHLVPEIVHEPINLEIFFQPIDLKNVVLFDSKFDHPHLKKQTMILDGKKQSYYALESFKYNGHLNYHG
jgi:hypothetical protein